VRLFGAAPFFKVVLRHPRGTIVLQNKSTVLAISMYILWGGLRKTYNTTINGFTKKCNFPPYPLPEGEGDKPKNHIYFLPFLKKRGRNRYTLNE